jgi:hypothetical protein
MEQNMIDRLDATVVATAIGQQVNRTGASVPSFHHWVTDTRSGIMKGGGNDEDGTVTALRAPDESSGQAVRYQDPSGSLAIIGSDTSADALMVMDAIVRSIAASAGIDLPPQVLESHSLDEHGKAQILTLPWRLVASGSFDQVIGSTAVTGSQGLAEASMAYAVLTKITSSGHASLPLSTFADADALPGPVATRAEPQHLPFAEAASSPRFVSQTERLTHGAIGLPSLTDVEWLVRWLRWTRNDAGDMSLRLRDYRLSDEETGRVVNDLRRFAQASNLALQRIVVNGHEVWRNQNGLEQEEISSCR